MEIRFTSKDVGCHLEGAHGWHNNYRVIDMALFEGLELDDEEKAILGAYRASEGAPSWGLDNDSVNGAVLDQGGLVDRATEFLDSVTAEGLEWAWDMGELSLVPVEDEDA